ncbi:inverse autotransporter beta domain-containing protein [Thalassoglobus sp.]|uniref:inverse autotransporter beta domain-containing protein n=1 Tax=Thalassoglobus sp. TaxID=2795869 RepID=UPI003AA7AB49
MKRLIFSMATVASLLVGGNAAHAQTNRWDAYLEIEGRGGDREERSQTRTFLPIFSDSDSLLFGDIRMMYSDKDTWEGNFGIGYRQITASQRIFGAYGFYDIRDTDHNNVFHQATLGAELLDINWGLRSNVYLPDTSSQRAGGANAFLQGNQILVQGNQERAYYGVDVEAEHILWRDDYAGQSIPGIGGDMEIWAAGGYFHFDNDASGFQHIAGPRARVEARLYDLPALGNDSRLVLSGQYEYDDVRGSVSQGFLSVRIPLGGNGCKQPKLGLLDRRMVTPIVRDIDIITNVAQAGNIFQGVNAKTGTVLDDVVTLTAADNVRNIIENGPNGRTYILDGVDGPFAFGGGPAGAIDLNNRQILIGGGGSMNVVGAGSNLNAVFTAEGEAFTFQRLNDNGNVINLARHNGIYGLTLDGGQDSIFGTNPGTFEIAGNTLMNASDDLIDIRANNGTTIGCIIDNTFLSNGDEAINIETSDDALAYFDIAGNLFSMTDSDGVIIEVNDNSEVHVDIRNNEFVGQGNDGVDLDVDDNGSLFANISNNIFDDVDDNAIEIDLDDSSYLNAIIAGNKILGRGNTGDGIEIDLDDTTYLDLVVEDNIFDDINDDAIDIDLDDNSYMNAMVAGNRFLGRGNTGDGIDVFLNDDSVVDLVVHHNIFDGMTHRAFEADLYSGSELYLDFHGNDILGRNTTEDGVRINAYDGSYLDAIVEGNKFKDLLFDGVHIDGYGGSDLVVDILDNRFKNVQEGNILVHAFDGANLDAIINNNNIKGGDIGIDAYGQFGGDHFVTIGGNKIRKVTGTGIAVGSIDDLFLDDAGMNNKVRVTGGGTVSDIEDSGDVIGTIRINGSDITVP